MVVLTPYGILDYGNICAVLYVKGLQNHSGLTLPGCSSCQNDGQEFQKNIIPTSISSRRPCNFSFSGYRLPVPWSSVIFLKCCCFLFVWLVLVFNDWKIKQLAEFVNGEGGKSSAPPNHGSAAGGDGRTQTKALHVQGRWRSCVSCGRHRAAKPAR